jgi:hypothetical protein
MRALLDTNIWRYIFESGDHELLFRVSRKSKVTICIAPVIVNETLRLKNYSLRNRLVELQTRTAWHRLMPDAYLQCKDIVVEMLHHHSEWQRNPKDASRYQSLRYDWIRKTGGFWDRARNNPSESAASHVKNDGMWLAETQRQYEELRSNFVREKRLPLKGKVSTIPASYKNSSGETVQLDFWRLFVLDYLPRELDRKRSPFHEWITCSVDLSRIYSEPESFLTFWRDEARTTALPREWMRAAFFVLQWDKKYSDGHPSDNALSTHAADVDVIVSADKAFVELINKCREEAPAKIAKAVLVAAGDEGAKQTIDLIGSRFGH